MPGSIRHGAMCAMAFMICSISTGAAPAVHGKLRLGSRADLAIARARGDKAVELVLLARQGRSADLTMVVRAAGGTIERSDAAIDYLRARVPIERAEAVADDDSVDVAELDVLAFYHGYGRTLMVQQDSFQISDNVGNLKRSLPSAIRAPQNGKWPWDDDPLTKPYYPFKDLGLEELTRNHPTYDGRGIVIAHVEFNPDILRPEFVEARSLDGRVIPKILDWRNTSDPDHDHGESADGATADWVKMSAAVKVSDKRMFSIGGKRYLPPRSGTFRFGRWDSAWFSQSWLRRDTHLGEEPDPALRFFGVLWDPATDEVWVDTNQNESFADETPLTDYGAHQKFGVFGHDDPQTLPRESYAFRVQIDRRRSVIGLGVGIGGHATMVAASAAASIGRAGKVQGVAPGSQLIELDPSMRCAADYIEGLIAAFSDARVDLVLIMGNVQVDEPQLYRDGRSAISVAVARLIDRFKKPFVVPASNNPGVNTVSEESVGRWSFSVGAYETRESYSINSGYLIRDPQTFHAVGSWGPSGLGGIKPDIVVPSGWISLDSNFYSGVDGGNKGLYQLPSGYSIGGGTSQAAPTMAGALAVLMSAAKQEKIPYDVERLWRAVMNSARYIPTLQAHQQGRGAMDVGAALALLKRYAAGEPAITIESRVAVTPSYTPWLDNPEQGVGIWEPQGWRPGQRGQRSVTLERTDGPAAPMTFSAHWTGDTQTYSSSATVTLPLRVPVAFPIAVEPKTAGAHTALLTLDHPQVPGHAHQLMATIIAAEPLSTENQFTLLDSGKGDIPGRITYALAVPPDAEAAVYEATGSNLLEPWLLYTLDPLGRDLIEGAHADARVWPQPGMWSTVFNLRGSALNIAWQTLPGEAVPAQPYAFKASILRAEIQTPASLEMRLGTSVTMDVSVRNAMAGFKGGLVGIPLGSQRTAKLTLRPRQQQLFDVQVPEGSALLFAQIGDLSSAADVDLYLFDCTGQRCIPAQNAIAIGHAARLMYHDPRPGLWKIALDASRAPPEGVSFSYQDVVMDPALGSTSTTEFFAQRDTGARWNSTANVWLARLPPAGRDPVAVLTAHAMAPEREIPVGMSVVPIHVRKK